MVTVLTPGWWQFAVDHPMTALGQHPAALVAILGSFAWVSWISGRQWLATYTSWHRKQERVKSEVAIRLADAQQDADRRVTQAESAGCSRVKEAEREGNRRVDWVQSEGERLVADVKREADIRVYEASANVETEAAIKARAALDQLWVATTRIHELEAKEHELLEQLAKPDADDQRLFDKILTELPEDHGRLGWLYIGRFAGKSWKQSDMRKISDFTDAYANQTFRNPVVQATWTNLWDALNAFWRKAQGETTSDDIPIGDGDYFCEIKQQHERDETSPTYDQTAEELVNMKDEIFRARDQFIAAGIEKRFSRQVLIDAIAPPPPIV